MPETMYFIRGILEGKRGNNGFISLLLEGRGGNNTSVREVK